MKKFILVFLSLYTSLLIAQNYDTPFYVNGNYDSSIPSPKDVLEFEIGDKPINHSEV